MASKLFDLASVLVSPIKRKNLDGYENWVEFQIKPHNNDKCVFSYCLRKPDEAVGKTTKISEVKLPQVVVSNIGETTLFQLIVSSLEDGTISLSNEVDLGSIPMEKEKKAEKIDKIEKPEKVSEVTEKDK